MDDDRKGKIIELVKGAASVPRKRATRSKAAVSAGGNVVYVNAKGDAQVAGRDINIRTEIKTEKFDARPHVHVKTGDGAIDAKQKHRLLSLRDDIYTLSAAIQKEGRSKAAIMGAMNKAMRVNSYHELKAEQFAAAEQYLINWRGRLNSMPSAPNKSGSWYNSRIRAIQTRCNQMGWQPWRKDYMRRTFGKDSAADLDDDQLERLYRAVMSKR